MKYALMAYFKKYTIVDTTKAILSPLIPFTTRGIAEKLLTAYNGPRENLGVLHSSKAKTAGKYISIDVSYVKKKKCSSVLDNIRIM